MHPLPSPKATTRHHGSLARLGRLCLKELRENLRDRRTITTLILMPLLLYPILSIIFQRFLLTGELARVAQQIVLGVPDRETEQWVQAQLLLAEKILSVQAPNQAYRSPTVGLKEFQVDETPNVFFQQDADLERQVVTYQIDLGIRLRPATGSETQATQSDDERHRAMTWELIVQDGSLASSRALQYVHRRLAALNEAFLRQRLQQLGDSGAPWTQTEIRAIGQRDESGAVSLAMVIPLVLILMTMTGAVYPAIDSTAGERERGTLEAVIATPVPRFALLLAKYLAVVTVSVLTATANLMAMTITLQATGIAHAVLGTEGLAWRVIAMAMALLLVFAVFFSAVVLAVTSFARSFKEAQAYLIPLILVSLVPSLICLSPGVQLGPALAVAPLINLVLLAREIFGGSPVSGLWLLVVASSILYAVAAVAVAARIFGSDAVLYGSDVTWRDFFRRPDRAVKVLGSHSTVLALAVIMPAYILLASAMARLSQLHLGWLLGSSAVVTIVLFGLAPLAIAWHQRLQLASGFQCRWPSARMLLAALLLGLSIWPLLLWAVYHGGLTSAFADRYEAGQKLIAQFRQLPWPIIILCLAIVPALVEEWFFRGFVFSSLLADSTPRKAILVSAFLFGLFHVLGASLSPERFLPSAVMGLILGWLCWRSGSVFPGMLLHAVHNTALVLLAYFQDELTRNGWLDLRPVRVAVGLAVALVAALTAWWLVRSGAPAVVAAESARDDDEHV